MFQLVIYLKLFCFRLCFNILFELFFRITTSLALLIFNPQGRSMNDLSYWKFLLEHILLLEFFTLHYTGYWNTIFQIFNGNDPEFEVGEHSNCWWLPRDTRISDCHSRRIRKYLMFVIMTLRILKKHGAYILFFARL